MKPVARHELTKTFRYFIRSIIPMFVLLLSIMVVGCGATPAATNKSGKLTAKTSYDNNSEACAATGKKAVNYDIIYTLTAGKADTKADTNSGTICVKAGDNNTDNVIFKTGYPAVQVLVSNNHDELIKCTTEPNSKDNVYVTISKFQGAIGTSQLNEPFHTNLICSGEVNSGGDNTGDGDGDGDGDNIGDNETLPVDNTTLEITVRKIPYDINLDGNVMPKPEVTSYLGLRSSIITAGDEIHLLYGFHSEQNDSKNFSQFHYSYNVKTKKWTNINNLDTVKNQEKDEGRRDPTVDAAITSHGGKVYIYGGRYAGGLNSDDAGAKKALTAYNITEKKWENVVAEGTAADAMPSNASDLATVGAKIYRFGGAQGTIDTANSKDIHVLDTTETTPTWAAVTTSGLFTPSARMYHRSAVIGSKIYYYGGVTHYQNDTGVADPFVVFDTESSKWEKLDSDNVSKVRSRFSLLALDSNTLFISSGAAAGSESELNSYIYKIKEKTAYALPIVPMIKSFTAEKKSSVTTNNNFYQNNRSYDYVTAYYTFANKKIYLLRVQPVDRGYANDNTPAKEIEVYTIEIKEKK